MKLFERIFLYSVIAILAFSVFLADSQVESQVAIQEEIRAKRIVIVDDDGQEVVELCSDINGGEVVIRSTVNEVIFPPVSVSVADDGTAMIFIFDSDGLNIY